MLQVSAVVLGLIAVAVPSQAASGAELRVTRVALFSSGVAYFECDAEVTDNDQAELTFRTAQINDIIKSLMVQDMGGGRVGVVSYASQDPVEKALKSFGVDITAKPTLAQLLDQLRGEPVTLTGKRALSGTILGVEKQKTPAGQTSIDVDVLTVLTAQGIAQVNVSDIEGIQLSNEKIDNELRKALATLATSRDAGKKSVLLRFDGNGKRKVRVAYLLEAPIWKTSYRLMLSPEGKPYLQGWATVENATEEDWKDVKLTLVSGRPISFTMDLYTPLYIPRPHEELELYASLRPPTYEGGIVMERAAAMDKADGGNRRGRAPGSPPPPAAAAKLAFSGSAREDDAERDAGGVSGAGVESIADAQRAGELFQYAINVPVSIGRQHSAMLPIVNQEIEGDKVSIYNPATHAKHPLNGLLLRNTSGLNLMQGPVTLFDGGVYAGDAKLPDLKPDEQRLIGYALDLGVEVMIEDKPQDSQALSVRIAKGVMIRKLKYIDDRTYQVKNKDAKPRTLIIEQPYGNEWTLVEPKEPMERTQQLSRFKLIAAEQKTTGYRVRLEQTAEQSIAISNMGSEQIQLFLRGAAASKSVTDALEKVVGMRADLDRTVREREAREKEVAEQIAEQARVRDNLKTLEKGTDGYKRQDQKFNEIETQIENLRKQIASARSAEEQKRQALEAFLLGLSVE